MRSRRFRTPGTPSSILRGMDPGFTAGVHPCFPAKPGGWRTVALAETFAANRRGYTRGGMTTALIFLPPALVLFTVFVVLPIGEAGWYALFNWNGLRVP